MENTDKSLVEAHCRGDQEAFGELVRRYGGCVLGYLTKISGRGQADDLFQETFKRVHEKAHTFRGSRFRPWLFKIATNVALDGLRRRGPYVVSLNQGPGYVGEVSDELGATVTADNCPEPYENLMMAERKEQVRRAIESLPDRQRATLILAYYQQLSYREVAEALGCSIGTVKMQMCRALRTLAAKLPDVSETVQ